MSFAMSPSDPKENVFQDDDPSILSGHYAKKQLGSQSRLIRFSHRRRFEVARQLVTPYRGKRLLDYGSGDGTFLALVHDLFPQATGADFDDPTERALKRLGHVDGMEFVTLGALNSTSKFEHTFDVVTCMETLEHCVDLQGVLRNLRRCLAPDGVLIVSVPIEIGPVLGAKQAVRTLAGWRRIGDYQYRERYSVQELARMFFADENTTIMRPVYPTSDGAGYHGHKGFNWKALRRELEKTLIIRRQLFSPFNHLGALANSQAWFVCERR